MKTEDKEDTDLLRNSNRQLVEFKKKMGDENFKEVYDAFDKLGQLIRQVIKQ